MEQLLPIFAQYGLTGVVLVCCGYYVTKHDQACNDAHDRIREEHGQERVEWKDMVSSQHKEALEATVTMTTALAKNSQALAELSTLLRDRK